MGNLWRIGAILMGVFFVVSLIGEGANPQGRQPSVQGMGILHAPDFPPSISWFNTDRPLSLKALRGKFV